MLPVQAEMFANQVKKMTPGQLRMVLKGQQYLAKVQQAWQWLKQNPMYLYAIILVLLLLVLRWIGWI